MVRALLILLFAASMATPVSGAPKQGAEIAASAQSRSANSSNGVSNALPLVSITPVQMEAKAKDDLPGYLISRHADEQAIRWTDVVIAVFTIILGVSGIAAGFISYFQWQALKAQDARIKESIDKAEVASKRQSDDMRSSLAVAGEAAAAARLSAQVASGVELAHFSVAWAELAGQTAEQAIRGGRFSMSFKNLGKSYGEIISAGVVCLAAPVPPPNVYRFPPEQIVRADLGRVVESGGDYYFAREHIDLEILGDVNEAVSGKIPLWAYGFLRFVDSIGNQIEERFVIVYRLKENTFTQGPPTVTGFFENGSDIADPIYSERGPLGQVRLTARDSIRASGRAFVSPPGQ